jgi:putative hydrolase of the HAD superfamily
MHTRTTGMNRRSNSQWKDACVSESRVVLWDFDGTLAQRPGRWSQCLVEAMARADANMRLQPEDVRPGLANGFPWHRHAEGHPELADPDAWWSALMPLLVSAYTRAGVQREIAITAADLIRRTYVDPAAWIVYSDTKPALTHLREHGWRHLVVSNHVPELPDLVTSLGLADLVEDVLTSAATGWEKPHPAMFRQALDRAGNAERVIMVGDNPEADIAGARRAGIPALLVRQPNSCGIVVDLHTAADQIITGHIPRRA